MAYSNVSRPRGFVPLNESVGHAHTEVRPVPNVRQAANGGNASTDLAVGDAYALDASGNVYRAGPNDTIKGVVIGFELKANPTVMNGQGPLSVDYITGSAGTPGWPNVIGIEDSKCIFECQSDTFAATNVNGEFNLTDAAPDSLFRVSQQKANIAGGAGAQLKAIGLVNSPADNAYGANAQIMVQFLQMTP